MYPYEEPIYSLIQGNGPPVILIHGMAAASSDWEALIPELVQNGYRACALDLLGHGLSAKPDDPQAYHSRTFYTHLERWIQNLCLDQPVVIVGHSLGGYLGLGYTLRHPNDVRGLVLINPLYSPRQLSPVVRLAQRRPRLGKIALRAAPLWLINTFFILDPTASKKYPAYKALQLANDLKRASPNIVYLPRTFSDLTPRLNEITTPTRVIWGEKDLTLHPASFPHLVKTLPNANGYPIPDSGHQPHFTHPEIVNGLVMDFLRTGYP
jgi:4,5:9,10-diseco-3-hydroxy-5,9,17-trioxoandrosta-1(10),2-diene-4-oate hydrolase